MRRLIVIGILLGIMGANARADLAASLLRWNGKGEMAVNRGPGQPTIRMVAVVSWAASAPRDPYRYAVRVTLPDGQTLSRSIEVADAPPSRSMTVLIPADRLLDLRPEQVKVLVEILDTVTGAVVSDRLEATIDNFDNPGVGESDDEKGPFGWGVPLRVPTPGAAPLPRLSPSGRQYLRVSPGGDGQGFTIATAESSVADVKRVIKDYDPRSGRSDDFRLEEPDQPAVALSPSRASAFLDALGHADGEVAYRFPTEAEWLIAARSGKDAAFWWGEQPTFPQGANFLGSEPALAIDTTAPVVSDRVGTAFEPNPWGLFHTFGNVAEWAKRDDGSFVRLGGHFRTEPAVPLTSDVVDSPDSTGPDPYVGVRPVLDLDAARGSAIARKSLGDESAWSGVNVSYDPDTSTVLLTGKVEKISDRKLADQRLADLWFVAAVENKIEGPGVPQGLLATIDSRILARKRKTPLGQVIDEWSVPVRWAARLPVRGSHWYVNVFSREGAVFSYPLISGDPDPRGPLKVAVDRNRLGYDPKGVLVALSLGSPATSADAANVVSNVVELK